MLSVALIDGPLDGEDCPAKRHALAMKRCILQNAPHASVNSFPVFHGNLACDVPRVCNALDSAYKSKPDLVLCSFGLNRDADDLRDRVQALLRTGAEIVASRPARGGDSVWPGRYDGVFAIQGDARCGQGDWSHLGPGLWFGACAVLDLEAGLAGASIAAAHFAGVIASKMSVFGSDNNRWKAELVHGAKWVGHEQKANPRGAPPLEL